MYGFSKVSYENLKQFDMRHTKTEINKGFK